MNSKLIITIKNKAIMLNKNITSVKTPFGLEPIVSVLWIISYR